MRQPRAYLAAGVEERSAAIAWLNRGTDLQVERIVEHAAEGTHNTGGDREVRGGQSVQRIADRNNGVARRE